MSITVRQCQDLDEVGQLDRATGQVNGRGCTAGSLVAAVRGLMEFITPGAYVDHVERLGGWKAAVDTVNRMEEDEPGSAAARLTADVRVHWAAGTRGL